jgi:hypothetical protein
LWSSEQLRRVVLRLHTDVSEKLLPQPSGLKHIHLQMANKTNYAAKQPQKSKLAFSLKPQILGQGW